MSKRNIASILVALCLVGVAMFPTGAATIGQNSGDDVSCGCEDGFGAGSQTSKPTTKVSPKKVAPEGSVQAEARPYAAWPFDEAATSLPAFYRGHSVEALYKNSQAGLPKPDQAALYAFVPARPAGTPTGRYDADAHVLTVTMIEETSVLADGRSRPARAVTIRRIDARESTTRTSSERWTLVIQNSPTSAREAKIALSAPEASSVSGQLGIVYVCRAVGGSPWNSVTLRSGTWVTNTELHEFEIRYHYLTVDLVGVWLFDVPSGRILKKLAPDQL